VRWRGSCPGLGTVGVWQRGSSCGESVVKDTFGMLVLGQRLELVAVAMMLPPSEVGHGLLCHGGKCR